MDKERPLRRSAWKDVHVAVPFVSSSCQLELPSPAVVTEPDIYTYVNEDNFDC